MRKRRGSSICWLPPTYPRSWRRLIWWNSPSMSATRLRPMSRFSRRLSRVQVRVYASVGGCTDRELDRLLACFAATREIVLMHSNSDSGRYDVTHLRGVGRLKRFGARVGYSDTYSGYSLAIGAVLAGADIIEKGLVLDGSTAGGAVRGSIGPVEFRAMMLDIRNLNVSPGETVWRQAIGRDAEAVDRRRSLIASRRISKGTTITADMVTCKPPERGLSPRLLPWLLGRRAIYDIEEDDFITFGLVDLT